MATPIRLFMKNHEKARRHRRQTMMPTSWIGDSEIRPSL